MIMARTVNVGLIGAGRIGRLHAETLAHRVRGVRLLAVADVVFEAAEKCAADFDVPSAFKDHRQILDDPKIEAVAICSSTDTHASFIEQAAQAGKHIFCEKPIDFNLERIDRTLKAVEKAGVKLQIGFNRRFDPSFKRARDMVAAGKIGTPHIVRITSRDPKTPPLGFVERSGGMFADMTIHDFDMARYLVGSEVEEVYAIGTVLVDPAIGRLGDIDTAVVVLRYQNGAIGVIDNSRQAVYGYDQRIEVFGSEGGIVVTNPTADLAVLSDADGVYSAKPLYYFPERYAESFIAEVREFIECVQEDRVPPVTGIDARVPVAMAIAALKSSRENRPVKLSEIG